MTFLLCLFPAFVWAEQDFMLSSYQETDTQIISALGSNCVRIKNKGSEDYIILHKKDKDATHYTQGFEYNDHPVFSYTAALLHENTLIIATPQSGIDFVNMSDLSIVSHIEHPNLSALSLLPYNNKTYVAALESGREKSTLYIFSSHPEPDISHPEQSEGSLLLYSRELPYDDVMALAITQPYTLHCGDHRQYIILVALGSPLSVWSTDDIFSSRPFNFISHIFNYQNTNHLDLHTSSGTQDHISDTDHLSLVSILGEAKKIPLREVLSQAFSNRDQLIAETKEKHEQGIKEYEQSSQYLWVKMFNIVDGILQGIPLDDDMIPTLINSKLIGTTPRLMLKDDLKNRGLLENFTQEDYQRFSTALNRPHHAAEFLSTATIIAAPVLIKGRQWYRGYQAAKARQLGTIGEYTRNLLPQAARSAIPEVAAGAGKALERLSQAEALWTRPFYVKVGTKTLALVKQAFNLETVKMFPKVLLVTNATWGFSEVANQVKKHGWEATQWNLGQMTYNGVFINTLTGAIMIISAYKMNQVWKTVAIIGTIDVISPIAQKIENRAIHHDPTRAYDPMQPTFDKMYLAFFALPKSQLNYYFQPKAVNALKNHGAPAWVHEWVVPIGMNTTSEFLGNGGYAWSVEWGKEHLHTLGDPGIEMDQFDLQEFLNANIQLPPILEESPTENQ